MVTHIILGCPGFDSDVEFEGHCGTRSAAKGREFAMFAAGDFAVDFILISFALCQ